MNLWYTSDNKLLSVGDWYENKNSRSNSLPKMLLDSYFFLLDFYWDYIINF